MPAKLLILGGTAEATALASAIDREFGQGVDLITSLAGRMITLPDLTGRLRVGGFGGVDGLAAYLATESIGAVIDATHPFAKNISAHAVAACREAKVPLLALERPAWPRKAGDNWIIAPDMQAAASQVAALGKRVFLTIGWLELDAFRDIRDVWFLVRLIERPRQPLPGHWHMVLGRPPFDVEGEKRLMKEHGIDLVVSKASGGEATYGKIAAAGALNIPVLMIERPRQEETASAASLDEALAWIADTLFSQTT